MPVYEYACLRCGESREVIQRFSDEPLAVCPSCGGEMKKLISATSFVLKGSGWYATEYGARAKEPSGTGDTKPEGTAQTPESAAKPEPAAA